MTTTAIKVREKESWIHASHARKAILPDDPTATPIASPEKCEKQQLTPMFPKRNTPFQHDPYLLRSREPAGGEKTVQQGVPWSPEVT